MLKTMNKILISGDDILLVVNYILSMQIKYYTRVSYSNV